ncbi:hypothetical protein B0H11DRAFT_2168467 [Mycena galericulata]|nr:hypothetical protein B0H11DRAFT_2168467 [Mycena galericulata]
MEFLDLPVELLPDILSHLVNPGHLASACRVNKLFNQFGISKLYERASIYSWHKHAKAKVASLFDTLAHCPNLAKCVLRLEIRDFPKSVGREDLEELVIAGLRNCVNLRACTWTRDGALNSAVLTVLQTRDSLAELEINGHSDGHYDARILATFSHLQKLSLIMPSADVVGQLPPWMGYTGGTLRSLTLICKMSPLVTDGVLEAIAPSLANLEQFSITGCPRVTYLGIWAIISQSTVSIRTLGLEGLAAKFVRPLDPLYSASPLTMQNMGALSALCTGSTALARMTAVTLSLHTEAWMPSVTALLAPAPLEVLQIYPTSAFVQTAATDAFWRALITAHGARLTRFSVHRMPVSLPVIADVCTRCPALRQLFVVVDHEALGRFAECLSLAHNITTVHVNFQYRPTDDWLAGSSPSVLKAPEALAIVRRCPESITLFGCNARVWHVGRQIRRNESGELVAERFLAKYDSPDIPEQFLVVKN